MSPYTSMSLREKETTFKIRNLEIYDNLIYCFAILFRNLHRKNKTMTLQS